jgi:hypothetical protein
MHAFAQLPCENGVQLISFEWLPSEPLLKTLCDFDVPTGFRRGRGEERWHQQGSVSHCAGVLPFRWPFPAHRPFAVDMTGARVTVLQTNVLERRLFYVPSFKIYGSVAGFYDFGPPGCAIKQNITQFWRQHFVLQENMLEVRPICTRMRPPTPSQIKKSYAGHHSLDCWLHDPC